MLSRRILNWKLCGFGGTLNLMGFCGRSKLIYYEKNFQTSSPLRDIFRQSTIWLVIIFVFLVNLIKLEFVERVESPAHFPRSLKFIEQLIWHSWLAEFPKVATFFVSATRRTMMMVLLHFSARFAFEINWRLNREIVFLSTHYRSAVPPFRSARCVVASRYNENKRAFISKFDVKAISS